MSLRDLDTLTDKEKATLRLIVRGHDAKSAARALDLSVHTINERLREARRKLAVPSSREAARLLFEAEGGIPETVGNNGIGEDSATGQRNQAAAPVDGARRRIGPAAIIGVSLMSLTLALAAVIGIGSPTLPGIAPATQASANASVIEAATQWLAQLDRDDWAGTYRGTGAAFRKLNTEAVWAKTSEQVRARFGKVKTRTFLAQEELPAPPAGYQVVKFRAQYANKPDAVETVTFERENGAWKVVGIYVE
ncbi:helix-turn-helix domain-containing protein [Sphingomonas yantingensis]|uniref:DNA-binding CsgD family transcriptional regulator n=1 Tax=Sphingomonas yantingensis TaxID=1241761 RepID=A0A7W9ASJ8_9SPHN|nr:DUF4019 domain-containing protein [Sphingomonas yantingensis]MBB5699667.1 DNA-binding CsgD family transcriptional regulator [Sphingomonas yantingensis]